MNVAIQRPSLVTPTQEFVQDAELRDQLEVVLKVLVQMVLGRPAMSAITMGLDTDDASTMDFDMRPRHRPSNDSRVGRRRRPPLPPLIDSRKRNLVMIAVDRGHNRRMVEAFHRDARTELEVAGDPDRFR